MYKGVLKKMSKNKIKRESFALNVHRLRVHGGLSYEDLGDVCDVTPQTVSNWEKKGALPNVYTIAKLAMFFEVSIDELIGAKYFPIAETKSYFLRNLVETDREEFICLYNDITFGDWQGPDKSQEKGKQTSFKWEDFCNHLHTFVIYEKSDERLIGYFSAEFPLRDSILGDPHIVVQIEKGIKYDEELVELTNSFLDYIGKKSMCEKMYIYINSELTQEIFEAMGHRDITIGMPILRKVRP